MADIFPIVATVVYDGLDHTKILNKGERVLCYFCKEPITINEQSVFVHEDGTKVINCHKCGSHVEAFYYYDKQLDKKTDIPKKKRREKKKKVYNTVM